MRKFMGSIGVLLGKLLECTPTISVRLTRLNYIKDALRWVSVGVTVCVCVSGCVWLTVWLSFYVGVTQKSPTPTWLHILTDIQRDYVCVWMFVSVWVYSNVNLYDCDCKCIIVLVWDFECLSRSVCLSLSVWMSFCDSMNECLGVCMCIHLDLCEWLWDFSIGHPRITKVMMYTLMYEARSCMMQYTNVLETVRWDGLFYWRDISKNRLFKLHYTTQKSEIRMYSH